MYNANNQQDEHIYVATYKEIIFSIIIFVIVLVALYPKEVLKDKISNDGSNYQLNMVYLNDLLKHSPNDQSLKLMIMEQHMNVGKFNDAIKISHNLINSKNVSIRHKATVLLYQAKKEKYFAKDTTPEEKDALYSDLQQLFNKIFVNKLYGSDAYKWYQEALFAKNNYATYFFLQKAFPSHQNDIALLKNGYYFANKLHKPQESIKYLNLLEKLDTKNYIQWALFRYEYYMQQHRYKDAQEILKKYAHDSSVTKERLATFYLTMGDYKKASETYLNLFYNTKDDKTKRHYLKESIRILQSGNLLQDAASLAHNFESQYIRNKAMRKFFLRIYLAAGRLDYASALSKKILKYEY